MDGGIVTYLLGLVWVVAIMLPLLRVRRMSRSFPGSSRLITMSAIGLSLSTLVLGVWILVAGNLPAGLDRTRPMPLWIFCVFPVAILSALVSGSVLTYYEIRLRFRRY